MKKKYKCKTLVSKYFEPQRWRTKMVRMLASSSVDRGFESRSGQTKDYNIGICCFSAKHVALRSKNKDRLVSN